jgi:hypothetical protein
MTNFFDINDLIGPRNSAISAIIETQRRFDLIMNPPWMRQMRAITASFAPMVQPNLMPALNLDFRTPSYLHIAQSLETAKMINAALKSTSLPFIGVLSATNDILKSVSIPRILLPNIQPPIPMMFNYLRPPALMSLPIVPSITQLKVFPGLSPLTGLSETYGAFQLLEQLSKNPKTGQRPKRISYSRVRELATEMVRIQAALKEVNGNVEEVKLLQSFERMVLQTENEKLLKQAVALIRADLDDVKTVVVQVRNLMTAELPKKLSLQSKIVNFFIANWLAIAFFAYQTIDSNRTSQATLVKLDAISKSNTEIKRELQFKAPFTVGTHRVKRQTALRDAPDSKALVYRKLVAGSIVTATRHSGAYVLVRISINGSVIEGWVSRNAVRSLK